LLEGELPYDVVVVLCMNS